MCTADFLDDVAQCLQLVSARFGSSPLIRIVGTIAAWAIVVVGVGGEAAASRLSEEVRGFFAAACAELLVRLMDVAPRDLSNIAVALSSVGLLEERFFSSLARVAVARADRTQTEELLALVVAFERANLAHAPLLEALARSLRGSIREVPLRSLLGGFRTLAASHLRDAELGKALGDHVQTSKANLLVEDFCAIAWSFCILGFYHDQLFRSCFKVFADSLNPTSDCLCQLFEIHTTLKSFRHDMYKKYELQEDIVKRLKSHYKKHRGGKLRETRLDRADKVLKDVAGTLKNVVEDSYCYAAVRSSRSTKPILVSA